MKKLVIIDYGINNLQSVVNACNNFGINTIITNDSKLIKSSDAFILPGIGSFSQAMKNLKNKGLDDSIFDIIYKKKILIGICLGMQLLFEKSDEFGKTKGLSIFDGVVKKFSNFSKKKIPHIGWRNQFFKKKPRLTAGIKNTDNFYFVHSYYAEICNKNKKYIISTSKYYDEEFISIVNKENIYGFQFHPEKSGLSGLNIYKNLSKLLK